MLSTSRRAVCRVPTLISRVPVLPQWFALGRGCLRPRTMSGDAVSRRVRSLSKTMWKLWPSGLQEWRPRVLYEASQGRSPQESYS